MNNKLNDTAMAEPEAQNQIVVYQPNETVRLDVRLENETVWLTQAQLCDLFGVVKSNVSYHLKNIFGTNELDYGATVQKIRTVLTEAKFIRRAKKELIVIDAYPGVANGECCQCANVASSQFQFPMKEAA